MMPFKRLSPKKRLSFFSSSLVRHFGSAVALILLIPALGWAMDWSHYGVSRYGTEADIPSHFIADEAPASGDGRTFRPPSRQGEIRLFASHNILSETLAEYRQERLGYLQEDGFTLSQDQLGDNWFVLAGSVGDEVIYFFAEHGKSCGPDLMHHVQLRFPLADLEAWKPIIGRVTQSLDGPCE